jgi:hypothetical protein
MPQNEYHPQGGVDGPAALGAGWDDQASDSYFFKRSYLHLANFSPKSSRYI